MKHVPNTLTILRIVVTPVLIFLLFSKFTLGPFWALVLFVLASISDYLDGKLARIFGLHSRLGRFLDPFADKVLVLGTFTALSVLLPGAVPWWAVALIALRDISVTGLRIWTEAKGKSLKTIPMAKTKTTFQLIYLIGMLLLLAVSKIPGEIGDIAHHFAIGIIPFVLLMFVVLLTVSTGVYYFYNREIAAP